MVKKIKEKKPVMGECPEITTSDENVDESEKDKKADKKKSY